MASAPSASSMGRFQLELDGVAAGMLSKFSGLSWEADIATSAGGNSGIRKKSVTAVRCTPGRLSVGTGMGKALFSWIKASLEQADNPDKLLRGGSVQFLDYDFRVRSAAQFSNALITEFSVPALDASSKEAGIFELAVQAEQASWIKSSGAPVDMGPNQQKPWIVSNFKIQIADLPCARVTMVDSFSWRCEMVDPPGDLSKIAGPRIAMVTVPDIRLTLTAADYEHWFEAAKRWFVDGKCLESDEMSGRITLLSPTLKEADAIGTIDLKGVGFKSLTRPESMPHGDQMARFSAELYVEQMRFGLKAFGG